MVRQPMNMDSSVEGKPGAAGPALPATSHDCGGSESFALRVLGQSMAPEFNEGDIVIIEPGGAVADGSYVLAWHHDEWTFRQLRRTDTGWLLHAVNPAFAEQTLASLEDVRGVIIQKSLPGRRHASKRYI